MGDRCTGHCCKRFFLQFSPEELADARKMSGQPHYHPEPGRELPLPACQGGEQCPNEMARVAHMAVLVEKSQVGPDGKPTPSGEAHWYRCLNLLGNGDCGIYETRPKMCSGYPYGRPCLYTECTWDKAKTDGAGVVGPRLGG